MFKLVISDMTFPVASSVFQNVYELKCTTLYHWNCYMAQARGNNFPTGRQGQKFYHVRWYVDFHKRHMQILGGGADFLTRPSRAPDMAATCTPTAFTWCLLNFNTGPMCICWCSSAVWGLVDLTTITFWNPWYSTAHRRREDLYFYNSGAWLFSHPRILDWDDPGMS